jgi:hypothetical protein
VSIKNIKSLQKPNCFKNILIVKWNINKAPPAGGALLKISKS